MKLTNKELTEILVKENYISIDEIEKVAESCEENGLAECLIETSVLSKDIVGQALAEWYKVPYADINSNPPEREQVLKLREDLAVKFHAVVYDDDGRTVKIATDDPEQDGLVEEMGKIFPDKKLLICYSVSSDINDTFVHYRKALDTQFSTIIEEDAEKFAPEIIEAIIDDAATYRASDIHFEVQGQEVLIRFRIDGVLQEAGRIALDYYQNILNRVKIQAHLRIDEHSSPQDGAIRFSLSSGKVVDLRVSVVPTLDGEKIVMRVLSEYIKNFSTGDLGLEPEDEELLEEVVKKPFGLILAVGPTGSGKTTTLYTLLKKLNRPDVNITTIEDPAEYRVPGINQIQVNTQTGLTFGKGLRSIVRQDPNIILVGEIRDSETVEISINAALTGHLVLSTFHANDAATAIPRLVEMEAEPFLLSSTLEVILAQRLVRKICESCRYSEKIKTEYWAKNFPAAAHLVPPDLKTIYRGKGCSSCNHTGYKGRIGIFEMIIMTPELRDLILKNPSSQEIWKMARSQGARSMFESGIQKIKNGLTTAEEVFRVAPPRN
jgi:type IV pilus assembly protein PilB